MKKILILFLLVSLNSFADLKIGVYEGKQKGTDESCLMAVKEVNFKDGIKHPLHERVIVMVSQSRDNFELSHLPMIDLVSGKVAPEKGILTGAKSVPDRSYNEAVRLKMIHSPAYSGPTQYRYFKDRFEGEDEQFHCENLRFID